MLWAFQNVIAHVCSYSQLLDQFGFAIGVRNLYSIHIRKGTAVSIPDYVRKMVSQIRVNDIRQVAPPKHSLHILDKISKLKQGCQLLGFIFYLKFSFYDYNMHVEGFVLANLCLVTLLSSEQIINTTSNIKTKLIIRGEQN